MIYKLETTSGYKNQFSRAQPAFCKNEIEYPSTTPIARINFVL